MRFDFRTLLCSIALALLAPAVVEARVSWEHVAALFAIEEPQWQSGAHFAVALTIGNYADPVTGRTRPMAYEFMARRCVMSRATAFAAVEALQGAGLVEKCTTHRGRLPHVFQVLWRPVPSRRNGLIVGQSTVQNPAPTDQIPESNSPAVAQNTGGAGVTGGNGGPPHATNRKPARSAIPDMNRATVQKWRQRRAV